MEAHEIMSRDVVTLSPEMSIREALDALLHYRIHGAPVVDGGAQMVGMVSFTDLSARHGGKIRDIMTADAVSVSEDTPVEEIAALMLDQMVRRVPVVRGGRVIGIVSASDIIQVFLNLHEPGPRLPEAEAPWTIAPPLPAGASSRPAGPARSGVTVAAGPRTGDARRAARSSVRRVPAVAGRPAALRGARAHGRRRR